MIEQQFGDELRREIKDNRTYNNLYYYARFYSDADYGTTHVAVLAKNGDAVSVTSTINYRLVYGKTRAEVKAYLKHHYLLEFNVEENEVCNALHIPGEKAIKLLS